ncbi:DUF2189 domain-containing protein [Roseomonas sp. CAU 1739]|uniref:DUF2189 domain-containing protein n=1 Tax=Roseomonas sp. CAU 1739 TaxID=3140364 RepID=UPI00325C22DC
MAQTMPHVGLADISDIPAIRRIGLPDLRDALSRGIDDFLATPTQLFFLALIYPIIGMIAARAAWGGDLVYLIFPLIAGLSLMGPVAAIGLYEISRQREMGRQTSWLDGLRVFRSPAILSAAALGVLLLAIFLLWIFAAHLVYQATFAGHPHATLGALLRDLVDTREGWSLIVLGNAVGFIFAVVVLSLTVVAFPMILDREVGPVTAMRTSLRAVAANPVPMAAWGLVVAAGLLLGCLPLFVGLALVMPVLGHATWHLYRKVVVS